MKLKKRMTILLAVLLMFVNMGTVTYAASSDLENNTLLSYASTLEMDNYAHQIFERHLSTAIHSGDLKNFGFSGNRSSDYELGIAFTVTDIGTQENTYFYPILCDGDVEGLLQVSYDGQEYSSSVGKSFSDELVDLLVNSKGNDYRLYTDGNNLYACDGTSSNEIYQIYEDGNSDVDFVVPMSLGRTQMNRYTIYDLTNAFQSANVDISILASTPSSYKTINVVGVSQGSHPWCWAATCAAMINYYTGNSITASDVANYVFPDNPEQAGIWSNMKTAYNHWGLYPTQTGVISFSNVKSNINDYLPMHLGLSQHSVGLIGYEDWGLFGDKILIILEPNGGVRKTVTLKSNNNFDYYLSGTDAWLSTREF